MMRLWLYVAHPLIQYHIFQLACNLRPSRWASNSKYSPINSYLAVTETSAFIFENNRWIHWLSVQVKSECHWPISHAYLSSPHLHVWIDTSGPSPWKFEQTWHTCWAWFLSPIRIRARFRFASGTWIRPSLPILWASGTLCFMEFKFQTLYFCKRRNQRWVFRKDNLITFPLSKIE